MAIAVGNTDRIFMDPVKLRGDYILVSYLGHMPTNQSNNVNE